MRPSFAVEESLAALGESIKVARLKRRIKQRQLADRVGISLSTLCSIEKGEPGVSMGAVASVIHALGLGTPFADLLQNDPLSRSLDAELVPKRIRAPRKKVINF